MNQQDREIRQLSLNEEEQLLKDLYSRYEQASVELEHLLKDLMLSIDDPRVIYQMEYQAELEVQIQKVLADLNQKDEESVKGFLTVCAELGFIGALYSMFHHGLTADVNPNPTVTSDYAKRLAYHNAQLQLEVKSEISRGIASSMSEAEIAQLVKDRVNITRNKVATVARTEGGRVFEQNNYEAMLEAESAGAEVEKEWSSMLDSKVRNDHLTLHGQVVPLDEPFELNSEDGNTYYAMYPHGFGVAKEDVNCRCTAVPKMKFPTTPVNTYKSYSLFKKALIATGLAWLAFGNKSSDKT